jgi:hypothetical protein
MMQKDGGADAVVWVVRVDDLYAHQRVFFDNLKFSVGQLGRLGKDLLVNHTFADVMQDPRQGQGV